MSKILSAIWIVVARQRWLLVFGVLLVAWYLGRRLGWVSAIFLPFPSEVLTALWQAIADGSILRDILATAGRFGFAFVLALLIGTPLGILMGASRWVYQLLEWPIEFFRSIPTTALFPLFLLFFGVGDEAKIMVAAWGAGLVIIVNTMYAVHTIRPMRLLVARNLGLSRLQTMTRVIFWDALPNIVSGYRIALSLALVIIVVTEMFIGSTSGLGRRIIDDQLSYVVDDLYATILVTGILGFLLNKLLAILDSRIIHWRGR